MEIRLIPHIKLIFILSIVILFSACSTREVSSVSRAGTGIKAVCVEQGKPTQIVFPQKPIGSVKDGACDYLSVDRVENRLTIFATQEHTLCRYPVYFSDGTRYEIEIQLADEKCPRNEVVVM